MTTLTLLLAPPEEYTCVLKVIWAHRIKMSYLPGAFLLLARNLKYFQIKMNMDILSAREMSCVFLAWAFRSLSQYSSDISNTLVQSLISNVPYHIYYLLNLFYSLTLAFALDGITSLLNNMK